MGRYNFAPQRVHQAATRLIQVRGANAGPSPPWYTVIGNLPPSERLVRPPLQPAQRKGRKASKLFQPVKLHYEEDQLRLDFFGDHPWELARPRQVLENDGKDYQRFDWSQLDQPGKQVDGESVVQRQAWLMGLVRHEVAFPANIQLRDHLRSAELQEHLQRVFEEDYSVHLHFDLPTENFDDLESDVTIAIHLTYHPKYPHQFKDALKHLTSALGEQGLDTASINRRSFSISLPHSQDVAQALQNADLAAIAKQHNIDISLGSVTTLRPFGEDPFDVQPISLSFHRNASQNIPALIQHLTTLTNLSTEDVLRPALPPVEPDTCNAYTKLGAYDKARKEFYEVRHAQEVERRVAREEALWTGAEFGPSPLDIGMQLEDQKYEEWRVWADKEITTQKQLIGGSSFAGREEDAPVEAEVEAEVGGEDLVVGV